MGYDAYQKAPEALVNEEVCKTASPKNALS
jgi:hypothetical protein